MEKQKEDVKSKGQGSKDGSADQETVTALIVDDLSQRKTPRMRPVASIHSQ